MAQPFKLGSRSTLTILVLFAFHANWALAALDGLCPPLGAVLPPAKSPSLHPAVQSASELLREVLANVTGSFNKTGFSLGVQSIHEATPIVEYHHTPRELDPRGVQRVDSHSVYRLASTSKIFPVLAVLQTHGMDLNDPITNYLPELRALNKQADAQNAIWTVDWDEITLGALASHLGGPADLTFDLTTFPTGNFSDLGFPPIDESLLLNCSILSNTPCESHVFWDLFGHRPTAYAPFANPVYSNIGFAIIGWAVEKATNISFDEYVDREIWGPTGMHHTFATCPDDKLGVIPLDSKWWNASIGFESAAGGYYSTLSDMLAFGVSILTNKQLSPAKTRRWLKPVVSTAQVGMQVGAPWEIYRATNITADGRLIELYTKMGNIFDYDSLLVLIPDYDLVIDILAAGPESSGGTLLAVVTTLLEHFLPALELAGKDETRKALAGTYVDTTTNSSITLSLDDENPGISVANWTVRGVHVLDTWPSLDAAIAPEGDVEAKTELMVRYRLYPTGLETDTQSAWRGVKTAGTPEQIAALESVLAWPMGSCWTWAQMDRDQYGLKSVDHFVFDFDKDPDGVKEAVAVELPAYRVTLKKEVAGRKFEDADGQRVLQ